MSKNAPLQGQFGKSLCERRPGVELSTAHSSLRVIRQYYQGGKIRLQGKQQCIVAHQLFRHGHKCGMECLATFAALRIFIFCGRLIAWTMVTTGNAWFRLHCEHTSQRAMIDNCEPRDAHHEHDANPNHTNSACLIHNVISRG